jgi:hypothetical protein
VPGLALEYFHLLCSVSGAKKEAFAIGAGNGLKGGLGRLKQFLFRTRSVAAQGLILLHMGSMGLKSGE